MILLYPYGFSLSLHYSMHFVFYVYPRIDSTALFYDVFHMWERVCIAYLHIRVCTLSYGCIPSGD